MLCLIGLCVVACLACAGGADATTGDAPEPIAATASATTPKPVVTGLDHVVLVVDDLDAATRRFEKLGFATKPGRPHDNGITNRHVKFPSGTEIELLTVPREPTEGDDALAAEYREHVTRGGPGPRFVAFHAADTARLIERLEEIGQPHRRAGVLVDLSEDDPLRPLFFGPRNQASTDRPEHFAHPNGARELVSVWLAGNVVPAAERFLIELGATVDETAVSIPRPHHAHIARLSDGGSVVLLPDRPPRIPGRPIVGVTIAVDSLDTARAWLAENGLGVDPSMISGDGRSLFVPPGVAYGMWVELRELDAAP